MVFLKCFSLHTLPGLHHDLFLACLFRLSGSFFGIFWKVFLVEVLPGKGHPGDANDASYALYFSIVWASPSTGHAGAEKGQEQEFYSGLRRFQETLPEGRKRFPDPAFMRPI